MANPSTVADVLRMGIEREIESQRLYTDLGRKAQQPAAEFAFSVLSQDERRHQEILESYLAGGLTEGALKMGAEVDYRIVQQAGQAAITPDMKLPDVFLVAATREKQANDFYLNLAALHPPGQTRQLLEKLAAEELGHKLRVETLYTEVAFPQTDGG